MSNLISFGLSRDNSVNYTNYRNVNTVPYAWGELSDRTDNLGGISVGIRWESSVSTEDEHRISDRLRREMRQLQSRISDLEIENKKQLQTKKVVIEENGILIKTNHKLHHDVEDLRNNIQKCNRMQHRLEIQNRIINVKNNDLQKTLETLQQDKKKLMDDLFKTKCSFTCEIEALTDELERKRIITQVGRKEYVVIQRIQADVTSNQLRESNADLHNKLEKLHLEKEKWNEILSRERDTRQKLENSKLQEINQLHNQVETLNKQLLKMKADAEFNEQESSRMKKLLKRTNEETVKLREKNSELQNKVEQLKFDKTQLADALKHEKDHRKNKESDENSILHEEVCKLQKEVEQLHRKSKCLNDELTLAKESAMKKENECITLQTKLTEKNIEKANINAAEEIQKTLRENSSELQDTVEQLLLDKKMLTEELRREKDTVTKKDSHENSKLKEQIQKLQNEFDEMDHENQSLKKQLIREKENFKLKEKECIDMHQMMKIQKEQDLNLNVTNVRTKQLGERNVELQNEIQQLLQERSNMTDELKHEKEVRKKLEQYGNTNLQETNRTLRIENERLREDLSREKDNFKKMEVEFYKRSSDIKEKLEKQEQELVRLTTKLSEKSVLNRNVDPGAKKPQADLQQQLDETRARMKNLQKELDDAKSRLSRAMGDRLTDNNPNIADLSDKNRPTKISERFQELYDNQWTDAFEIVNGKYRNEENTINILRDILMDTLEFCKTQAANQMIQIRASFLKGEDLPANMNKQVKECRKAMAELYGKGLYREYCDQLRTSKPESMSTPSYVKECFEICWLMAVQDPPVEFGPDLHRGDTFNNEHYRAYTRSGERVEFVVWPVLLLHQNGPVLCKGVAQGK